MTLFLTALLVGYSGAMMPGPLLTYTIERSLNRGWKVGLLAPLGHVLFEMVIVLFIVLGLGSFLNNPVPRIILFFMGGAVLLWFAIDMIVSAVKNRLKVNVDREETVKRGDNFEIVMKSAIISVINPYFLLWWATIGLGFLVNDAKMSVGGVLLFYSGHALADFSWYFVVSLLCGKAGKFIGGRVYRYIIAALGILLAYFAARFIIDGIVLLGSIHKVVW